MLGPEPADVAVFLARTEGLDKTTIGDYLGEREDTALKVGPWGLKWGGAA
jgi:brefeldin A-inhibited guanine nucleotide-exchange protein